MHYGMNPATDPVTSGEQGDAPGSNLAKRVRRTLATMNHIHTQKKKRKFSAQGLFWQVPGRGLIGVKSSLNILRAF